MKFRDQISFIFQHIKKSKLRITMTILATTIGCAFLIVLASVAFGMQKTFEDELFSNDSVTEINLWEGETLTDDDLIEIEKMDHINVVLESNQLYNVLEVGFEDRNLNTYGSVLDMDAYGELPSTLNQGRLPENENEIVVGYHFAQSLINEADKAALQKKNEEAEQNGTWYDGSEEGYKGDILNKTISLQFKDDSGELIESKQFKVVGIKQKPDYEYNIDSQILFHQNLLYNLPKESYYTEQTIYVDSVENVLPIVDELKEQGFKVYSQMEQLKEIKMVFLVIKIGLIFVGTIAVLIASIGIFNTMTMAVTERTREIGILKAIGASPKLIQRLFLMESLLIGLIGTGLAIVISYAISIIGNFVFPLVIESVLMNGESADFDLTFSVIPMSLLLIASFISLFVAVVSGWRPARKATKIEVVKALQQM